MVAMIDMYIDVDKSWWRRPRKVLAVHTPTGVQVIARFTAKDGHELFLTWLSEQADEIRKTLG